MATPEALLTTLLLADAGVAAEIGNRLSPAPAKQGTAKPYATYQRIDTQGVRSLTGPSGLAQGRFQIDAWAATLAGAITLADAVRAALDGFQGTVGGDELWASRLDEGHGYDAEAELHRVRQDYSLWWRE